MLSYRRVLKSDRIVTLLISIFIVQLGQSQNLVPNGDFESYKTCPISSGSLTATMSNYVNSWFGPTGGTSDYYNRCALPINFTPINSANVPLTYVGYQNARSGDGFCGFIASQSKTSNSNQREYISAKLTAPLVAGECYDFEMYVNSSNRSNYSIADLGAHFSVGKVVVSGSLYGPLTALTPQITNSSGIITDTLNWILISGTYMASGGEDHVTIGNFKDNVNTNSKFNNLPALSAPYARAYYYVDDVCLQKCLPPLLLGNDTILCLGQTLTLGATTTGVTYLWHDNSTNATFNVTQAGTYWVEIMNSCGKTSSDTIVVDFDIASVFDLGNDTILCQGQALTLDAAISGITYLWQDNSTAATFDVIQGGTYWVDITNNCGKISSDTIIVDFNTALVIDLGKDTVLCQGEVLTLDATNQSASYLWQDNSTDSTLRVVQAGTNWVEIANNCGLATDTIIVDFNVVSDLDLGNDTVLCQGETLMLDATNVNVTYLWQDNSTTAIFNVVQEGIYWVQINDNCGSLFDTINVSYDSAAIIDLINDTVLCEEEILTLDATTPGVTYLWQDNSTAPTFNVDQEGLYWVEIANSCGITSDTVVIDIKDCSCLFFVPNSFTPNFDNQNDEFAPKFDCDITEYSFSIYDRWGALIFKTNAQKNTWNGNYKGKLVQTGVYVYVIRYKYDGQSKRKTGQVNLLK